jgi:hypothetical protein
MTSETRLFERHLSSSSFQRHRLSNVCQLPVDCRSSSTGAMRVSYGTDIRYLLKIGRRVVSTCVVLVTDTTVEEKRETGRARRSSATAGSFTIQCEERRCQR